MIFGNANSRAHGVKLSVNFMSKFEGLQPEWGPLGFFTYKRTYSRDLGDGKTEEFWQTCQRVVEGCFSIQKIHCHQMGLPWNDQKAQVSAQEMYRRMWEFKFTPPGRGLAVMGTDMVYERGSASLCNCAFTSTENINDDFTSPFTFLMDMSLLGVGVGADTRGAGKVKVIVPRTTTDPFVVADTREGWVDLLRVTLSSFVGKGHFPLVIDYSNVRGRGAPLKTFGGTASGPKPLHHMIENIVGILLPPGVSATFDVDAPEDMATINAVNVAITGTGTAYRITSTHIVDVFNYIGKAVVAGNIRRTAEIVFGEPDDQAFMGLKQDAVALNDRRWASNNSVFGTVGMDYAEVAKNIAVNGEPGLIWLDNIRQFSRMVDPADNKDWRAKGANPCFAGETLIAVADGRGAVPIKQLVEEGNDVPVYSLSPSGLVEIKWARNPRQTRELSKLVEVVLDDDTILRVTPDHKMILLDGQRVEAKHLKAGDSLPRFTKEIDRPTKISQDYWKIYGNVRDRNLGRQYEHKMIAKFNQPDIWDTMYDEAKRSGWHTGGLVVHHKDFDGLNNAPSNLEIMTFHDHQKLHAKLSDKRGDKNHMWGKTHTDATKKLIQASSIERAKDPIFLAKLSAANTESIRVLNSERMSALQKKNLFEYYKEQEIRTDLDTVWVGDQLFAVKHCEVCKNEFVTIWGKRGRSYCSTICSNKSPERVSAATEGLNVFFDNRQRQVKHEQVMAFKDLEQTLGRTPKRSEWKDAAKRRGVPVRFMTVDNTNNPHAINSFTQLAEISNSYNHRVKQIRTVVTPEPVYNLSVDDNHTLAIVVDTASNRLSGIFAANCGEQSLESMELCNLVETYPAHHDSYEDFERTLKFAYMYAKTVTLVPTHDARANAVMMRNRRIGCSISGIAQAIQKFGRRKFFNWCGNGYKYVQKMDRVYSDWLGVPLSIKMTTVKPSGTVPLLCGATPGVHFPHSEFYVRHIRISNYSPLRQVAIDAGYAVYADVYADDTSVVVFPVKEKFFTKGKSDVSMWEQFALVADMQANWSDNMVSATITFNKSEIPDIKTCLEAYETKLKGISLLPLLEEDHGYSYPPYQTITEDQYNEMMSTIVPMQFDSNVHDNDDKFCDGDKCVIPQVTGQ